VPEVYQINISFLMLLLLFLFFNNMHFLKFAQTVKAEHRYTGLWIVVTLMSQSCWLAGMLM